VILSSKIWPLNCSASGPCSIIRRQAPNRRLAWSQELAETTTFGESGAMGPANSASASPPMSSVFALPFAMPTMTRSWSRSPVRGSYCHLRCRM